MPRPTYHLPCLFCGTNVQVRTDDQFLTNTKSKNGNSYNFCKTHWRTLRQTATPEVIDKYRRNRLPVSPQNLHNVLYDLAYEMKHHKKSQ